MLYAEMTISFFKIQIESEGCHCALGSGLENPEISTGVIFKQSDNRQGALADGLHGLNPRITAHRFTPVQKANSVDCATVKAIGTTVEQGQSYKRSNPSCELGAFFVLRHVKAWRGKEEIVSIHPWRTVQQRK